MNRSRPGVQTEAAPNHQPETSRPAATVGIGRNDEQLEGQTMDATIWIALAISAGGFLLTIISAVAAAVWAVGSVKSANAHAVSEVAGEARALGQDIRSLGRSVDGLREWLQRVDEKVDLHREETVQRLTRMESEIKRAG